MAGYTLWDRKRSIDRRDCWAFFISMTDYRNIKSIGGAYTKNG
jgi:hypothetical protein